MKKLHRKRNLKRLIGAIKSKHPAAYLGIIIKALSPITRSVDRIYQHKTRKHSFLHSAHKHYIFIVCPPRSGGTVIYQALTRVLPSVYLSNAHALFPSLGTRLLRARRAQVKKCHSFNNYYGYTSHLFDVYEGNEFFHWAHRGPPGICGDDYKQYIRTEFETLIGLLTPLPSECVILKNTRSYSILKRLHRSIPEIVFVRIRRDRSQVIESVLHAYHELGSLYPIPESLQGMTFNDPAAFAFAFIEAIEENLDEQFSCLPISSKFEISYEEFCKHPYKSINILASKFLKLPKGSVRECPILTKLTPSKQHKVSEVERLKIQALIQKKRGK